MTRLGRLLLSMIAVGTIATSGAGRAAALSVTAVAGSTAAVSTQPLSAAPAQSGPGSNSSDPLGAVAGASPHAIGIAGGLYHTCALVLGGSVMCWGGNLEGELGNGNTTSSSAPVSVSGLTGATAVSAGLNGFSCAIVSAGAVMCWGMGGNGELGNGSYGVSSTPVSVTGLSGATAISSGLIHTCVIVSGGAVECWGYNYYGQLGDGTTTSRLTPVAVSGLSGAIAIAAGAEHTCAIVSGGTVYCWGWNYYGQLGNGTTTSSSTPVAVSGLSSVIAITAGGYHTCAVVSGGSVYCWGENNWGQLGSNIAVGSTPARASVLLPDYRIGVAEGSTGRSATGWLHESWPSNLDQVGSNVGYSPTPMAVPGISGATAIAAHYAHTCAIVAGGSGRCWGANSAGQLGNGTTTDSATPVSVSGLSGATAIATGDSHTCAIVSGGIVSCWGNNDTGQLGNGTQTESATPVSVSGLSGPTAVSSGSDHTCAIVAGGAVRCWGDNYSGELGNGTTTLSSAVPVIVSGVSGAAAIAAGYSHTCATVAGGAVTCWGSNYDGELGNGTYTGSLVPVSVTGLTGATAIASGVYHTCAIVAGGAVECWGDNEVGELGNGTNTGSSVPVSVTGLTGATAIAAGGWHTCAIVAGGAVECWGSNGFGGLGNGTTSDSWTPMPVLGLTGAVAIAAGWYHTCAVVTGGAVECWGWNADGQLGNGTTASSSIPVSVSGLSGATAISASRLDTCAVVSGGVRCWGWNGFGQLGNGTSTDSTTPVSVSGLSGATAISSGDFYSCALLSGGTVKCWGDNFYGQLARPIGSLTPVSVTGFRGMVVVLLKGMTTDLKAGASPFTDSGFGSLPQTLRDIGVPASSIVYYSYKYSGSSSTFGTPYSCDTDSIQSIATKSIPALDSEIRAYGKTHPGVDFYLVGHSQGGVVAIGYLAYLQKAGWKGGDITGGYDGRLAGAISLDSPLGGLLEMAPIAAMAALKCPSADLKIAPDGVEFAQIMASVLTLSTPYGGTKSIDKGLFGSPSLGNNNQMVAGAAAAGGLTVVSIGNTADTIFDPEPVTGNSMTTQWLSNNVAAHVYSRQITDGVNVPWLNIQLGVPFVTHGNVLNNASVATDVYGVLAGGTPSATSPSPYATPAVSPAVATGSIAGTVTGAGGALLANIDVAAISTADMSVVTTTTVASGTYSVPLDAGTYVVAFYDPTGAYPAGYAGASGFTTDLSAAQRVTVGSGASTVNVALPGGHSVSGTVKNAGSTALANIRIEAYTLDGTFAAGAFTDSNGAYGLVLPAGTYALLATDYANAYAGGYYAGTSLSATLAGATSVPLSTTNVTDINFALSSKVHIGGTVTNAAPTGLAGILITATPQPSGDPVYAYTAADGSYSLTVGPGSYKISFTDQAGMYRSGYWSSGGFTADVGSATPVPVTTTDVGGINVVLPVAGATYNVLAPYRVLDSRSSTGASKFHSQVRQTVLIATLASGVPTTAVAVTGNVTVVGQTHAGYVAVAPSLTSGLQPSTSTINFPAGDTRANGVTVPLAAGGNLDFMYWTASTADTVQVIFDVTGYFSEGS